MMSSSYSLRNDDTDCYLSIFHPAWIRTPMAAAVLLRNPNIKGFVLEPETVADAIVAQVGSDRSGQVFLPRRMWMVTLLRVLPAWIQERVRGEIAHEFAEEEEEKPASGGAE
jgi:short-subunit dehydrogenase